MRRWTLVGALALAFGVLVGVAAASTPGADVRLTHDANDPGYVSSYTLATGTPYTDATLAECSRSRGRQNEPAIAVDPRNTNVILGSSNDYCGVYNTNDADGNPIPVGPIWMGYYRSENAGGSFVSSLIPGYPDDTSPYGQIAKQQVRTASAGDPVIAWDAQGRAFFGSESSDDPAGTPKTFGDVWVATYDNPGGPSGNPQNDGKRYRQTVAREPWLVGAEPARHLQRQDNDRGRPQLRRSLRQQRLLLVVSLQRQRRRSGDLLLPLDQPRRHVLARRRSSRRRSPTSSSRTSR